MSNLQKIKCCIFDLDGVIVHTSHLHYQAWKKIAALFDYTLTTEENESLKGVSRINSLEWILGKAKVELEAEEKEELCEIKNEWYLKTINRIGKKDMIPGVLEFIKNLKQEGYLLAVGSASKNARLILEKLDIDTLFEVIVDGNDVVRSKPDPEVFELAAKAVKCKPDTCVVFEDSIKGIEAAQTANMYTVGVGKDETLKKANLIISDFVDVDLMILDQVQN